MLDKIIAQEYSNPGEMVAKEYIKKFMKDVQKWSPEGIDYIRHLEAISNFNVKYSKNKKMPMKYVIQGMNEIDLAVMLYNTIETNGSCN
ncbi:MAG TPA: hypothetical protein PK357_01085 [Candidatus Pacearchaeota archaeon]|nr:hypothetical protein [Candidatus Pacearchaeota archaeon]